LGIFTRIEVEEVNSLIADTNINIETLKETVNGITDSTFICIDKENRRYILKIYESSTIDEVKSEIDILENLEELKVPHVLSSQIKIFKDKPAVLYSFIEGKIPKKINKNQIVQISTFISSLHTSVLKPTVKNIYSKEHFVKLLNSLTSSKKEFEKRYEIIKDIDLSSNSFIHGDLFPDNVKFIDEKLNGVYDFGQSCYGNSKFDLSVLVVSWCFENYDFNNEFYQIVLNEYNKQMKSNISCESLKPYLLYSCLYYALQRLIRVNNIRDYKEYLKKFDILEKYL
jgi:homoserine kinase type II